MSNTYAGTTLKAFNGQPATNDAAGFGAITYVEGVASARNVPKIARDWTTTSDDLVGEETNVDIKASAKWMPMEFTVSIKRGDPVQDVLRALEKSRTDIGSFEFGFPGDVGTYHVQAQVTKFDEIGGGGKDDIVTADVRLTPRDEPVYVAAA